MHNPADWWNMLSFANSARLCVRLLAVITVGGVIASCSIAGDATRTVMRNWNPVNWFGDDDEQKKPLTAGKPSAVQKGFPKLGSVPRRPERPSPEEQTKEIARGLAADTANARYSDQRLRQSTAVFGGQARPPSTITQSRAVSRPDTVRRQASPTLARANPPTVTTSPALRAPLVRPSAVRRPVILAPGARLPAVRPPAPIADQGIVSPPALVSPPSVVRPLYPIRPSAAVRPTAVVPAPSLARPEVRAPTVAAPPPVRVANAFRRPPVKRPTAPVLRPIAAPSVRRQFATPVGSPNDAPKPPPVAMAIGGSLNNRTAALRPPNPANVSRSTPASSIPVMQNAQGVPKSLQIGTIYFGDGSAKLSKQDRSILQAVTGAFQQMGGRVRVIGHSSMGAWTLNSLRREAVNFKMSMKRANAVAKELIRQGIPPENMEVVAEGDRYPVYAETSQAGAAHNRRTEIFIDYLERS
jgi:flagellar motor protein MotB